MLPVDDNLSFNGLSFFRRLEGTAEIKISAFKGTQKKQ
jgi:hypothetical protein